MKVFALAVVVCCIAYHLAEAQVLQSRDANDLGNGLADLGEPQVLAQPLKPGKQQLPTAQPPHGSSKRPGKKPVKKPANKPGKKPNRKPARKPGKKPGKNQKPGNPAKKPGNGQGKKPAPM